MEVLQVDNDAQTALIKTDMNEIKLVPLTPKITEQVKEEKPKHKKKTNTQKKKTTKKETTQKEESKKEE